MFIKKSTSNNTTEQKRDIILTRDEMKKYVLLRNKLNHASSTIEVETYYRQLKGLVHKAEIRQDQAPMNNKILKKRKHS